MRRDRCTREIPKNVLHSNWGIHHFLTIACSFLFLAIIAIPSAKAECRVEIDSSHQKAFQGATEARIVDAGFRAVTVAEQGRSLERTHLWLNLGDIPQRAHFVILESVWGAGPDSLSSMWGHALPIRNQHVFAYPDNAHRYRDQPFTLGLRFRFIYEDGSKSAASLPVFINHTGGVASHDGIRVDQVATFLCMSLLVLLWATYRRAETSVGKVRIAAVLSLTSLLFLAASPALPWMSIKDSTERYQSIDCHLGNEVQCATYAPDAGPNPVLRSHSPATNFGQRNVDVRDWVGASTALRSSLILCLILLLPALIWILVAPGLRAAHGAVFFGASAAGYCMFSALYFRATMPGWMHAEHYTTFDLTILCTGTIILSCGLIVFWSRFGRALPRASKIPQAQALEY